MILNNFVNASASLLPSFNRNTEFEFEIMKRWSMLSMMLWPLLIIHYYLFLVFFHKIFLPLSNSDKISYYHLPLALTMRNVEFHLVSTASDGGSEFW